MAPSSRIALAASALAAVASAQSPVPTPMTSCSYPLQDLSGTSTIATWDFTAAFNATSDYNWQDRNDLDVKNNTYTFQVCSDTLYPLPAVCAGAPNAPAYQVDNSTNPPTCFELGSTLNNARPAPVSYSAIDFRNPARGLAMTYGGGAASFCPNGLRRTFTLNFWCAPFGFPSAGPLDPNNGWNRQYWIDENSLCNYVANVYSIVGCPLECPRVGGNVCGGNGVCAFDGNIRKARCFCNDDYIEGDCSAPRYPFPSSSVAGSVIGGMLLGVAGAVGGVFWLQKRRASSVGAVDGFYGVVA